MKFTVKEWTITALPDSDGHLTLALEHEDGTKPYVLDFDLEENGAFVQRFSTPTIERAYTDEYDAIEEEKCTRR